MYNVLGSILGCVGLKKYNSEVGELVRMAVNTNKRSIGIGSTLVNKVFEYCSSVKYLKVYLVTGNPRSGSLTKILYILLVILLIIIFSEIL